MTSQRNAVSVIVPTYEESDNIRELTLRLFKTLRAENIDGELIIVDDDSGAHTVRTEGIVQQLKVERYPVRLKVRRKAEGRGLSSAVLLGFSMAKNDVILCMDADLQHEPEAVPTVSAPVRSGSSEFSVGSRLVEGGKVAGWTFMRKFISWGATLLARPLTPCKDPMSGFFCTTKEVLTRGKINTQGFKISLEIMARCAPKNIKDVPITFQDRVHGESKLTGKVIKYYIFQLIELYFALYSLPILGLFIVLSASIYYLFSNYFM